MDNGRYTLYDEYGLQYMADVINEGNALVDISLMADAYPNCFSGTLDGNSHTIMRPANSG